MKSSIQLPFLQSIPPWYRQPWPWILIALPAFTVLACIATLAIAMRNQDGLIAEDYYKQGLAINQRLEREQRAAELQLFARVSVHGQAATVRLAGNASPPGIVVRFVHPTRAGHDHEVPARRLPGGIYEAAVPVQDAARRLVQIEDLERTWRLTGTWGGEREFTLGAAPSRGDR